MRLNLPAALAAIAIIAGCSSGYDIKYDYDMQTNFSTFKTYKWIDRTITDASGSARHAIESNSLLDKRIKSAVDTQMAAKGFALADSNPDIYAVYHVGLKDKIDVTDWGYTYAGSYWGGGLGRNVDVYQYTEGTLIVDLVEAANKELAWRGSATGVVEPGRSPEQVQARINDVVARIFKNYPPKK